MNQESTVNNITFYQNLGKLFYAIAATDNVVRQEELNKLIYVVKNEWTTIKEFEADFKNGAENAIVNTFKWLHDDNEYNAKVCYNSFIDYMKENRGLFNNEINSLILKTAHKIAMSFSGQNKSELIMIAKLNIEFKKINNEK